MESEPHERERMKQSARPGEDQAVKVVENGGCGRSRGWKPATRNHPTRGVGSPVALSRAGDGRVSCQVYIRSVMVTRFRSIRRTDPPALHRAGGEDHGAKGAGPAGGTPDTRRGRTNQGRLVPITPMITRSPWTTTTDASAVGQRRASSSVRRQGGASGHRAGTVRSTSGLLPCVAPRHRFSGWVR